LDLGKKLAKLLAHGLSTSLLFFFIKNERNDQISQSKEEKKLDSTIVTHI
jgi:hypothetical protein